MLTGVCVFCVAGRGANIEHLFRYTGLAARLMEIEQFVAVLIEVEPPRTTAVRAKALPERMEAPAGLAMPSG